METTLQCIGPSSIDALNASNWHRPIHCGCSKITEEDEPSNQSIEVKDIKAWPWVADMNCKPVWCTIGCEVLREQRVETTDRTLRIFFNFNTF